MRESKNNTVVGLRDVYSFSVMKHNISSEIVAQCLRYFSVYSLARFTGTAYLCLFSVQKTQHTLSLSNAAETKYWFANEYKVMSWYRDGSTLLLPY